MNSEQLFQSELKTLGLLPLNEDNIPRVNNEDYREYIKVLFLSPGYRLQVDLTTYSIDRPSLLFVSPNQHLQIEQIGPEAAYMRSEERRVGKECRGRWWRFQYITDTRRVH